MEEMSVTRVALLGFGTVGSAVARRLASPASFVSPVSSEITLTHVVDRRARVKQSASGLPSSVLWTDQIDDVLASDVDIVIEAIGGVAPAGEWIRRALLTGKSVVTANKQVVAREGASLWRLAARQGRQFRFEAAVGGAMPIVRAVADGLTGDSLTRIVAVLNGTSNAVLSQMDATGCSMAAALADSRRRGFAENDPSADLDGTDARAKLAILCALAFGIRLDANDIAARSVSSLGSDDFAVARRNGRTIRQLAFADFDRGTSTLGAWVAPVAVDRDSIFGRTVGAQNVALLIGEHAGEIGIFGAGAGGDATAVAIIGDVVSIARDRAAIVPPPRLTSAFTLRPSIDSFEDAVVPTLAFAEAV
jgi:homoserine dehydrogenase